MLVSVGALGRMFQEFLDEECFADQHEEIIDSGNFEEAIMYAAFEQEPVLWD